MAENNLPSKFLSFSEVQVLYRSSKIVFKKILRLIQLVVFQLTFRRINHYQENSQGSKIFLCKYAQLRKATWKLERGSGQLCCKPICCRCLCRCVFWAVGLNPTHTTYYCQQNRGALSWCREILQKFSLGNWEELPNNVTNLQTNVLQVFK